jgi:small GTP-binding protein
MRILKPNQEALLKDERRVLSDLQVTLAPLDGEPEDQETLRQSILQLDELFLLVAVGEFNSGKSAVINALLGQRLLEEGVTPTTTQIHLVRYGKTAERTVVDARQSVLTYPVDFLEEMTIVDTPGTNAIMRDHEVITSQFVPRSDLVLFITSADRPFTESERVFLQHIRQWGKKVVFVINKIDILQSEEEIGQVKNFVRENGRAVLGENPEIFPVSARAALQGKKGEGESWKQSRFEPFERYLHDILDEQSRLRLKMLNPLGVGDRLVGRYLDAVNSRLEFLKTDFDLLADVEGQLGLYEKDMDRSFQLRMAEIENILHEMEKRGQVFYDETFRLARVFDLMSKSRIQQAFERQVIADVPQRIERKVNELIDWLVASNLRRWQEITEHLSGRPLAHQDRIIGSVGMKRFQHDRERMIEAVGRDARQVVESYDKIREAKAIAESAQNALAASAAVGAGAVGLGALITTMATTAAADVTGVLMASLMAALGIFIIPARRRQGKVKMLEKIGTVRTQLAESLRGQFKGEIQRSLEQINEAIAPYTRFVRSEKEKLVQAQRRLQDLRREMDQLKGKIEAM